MARYDADMPTYEYLCEACSHAWEVEQRITANPLTECPSCHEPRAKRQISSSAGFLLKGGGWTGTSTSTRSSSAAGLAPGSKIDEKVFHDRFESVSSKKPEGD